MSDNKKENYNVNVINSENKFDSDCSSSSGIDSKRDSSDDNCSEMNDTNLRSTPYALSTGNMNNKSKICENSSSQLNNSGNCSIDTNNAGGKQARFLINNVDNHEGNLYN